MFKKLRDKFFKPKEKEWVNTECKCERKEDQNFVCSEEYKTDADIIKSIIEETPGLSIKRVYEDGEDGEEARWICPATIIDVESNKGFVFELQAGHRRNYKYACISCGTCLGYRYGVDIEMVHKTIKKYIKDGLESQLATKICKGLGE